MQTSDEVAFGGKKKVKGKKGSRHVQDDDLGTANDANGSVLEAEPSDPKQMSDEVAFSGKKKAKGKKASKYLQDDDDFGIVTDVSAFEEKPTLTSEEPRISETTDEVAFVGKKKGKGKKAAKHVQDDGFGIDDGPALDEELPTDEVAFVGKKKGKGKKASKHVSDEDFGIGNSVSTVEEELTTDEVAFVGKKKGKGKKPSKHVQDDEDDYPIINDVSTVEEEPTVAPEEARNAERTEVAFVGKKKATGKKGSKPFDDDDFGLTIDANAFSLGLEDQSAVISDEEEPILFTGKKKAKKGKKESSKKPLDDEEYEVVAPPVHTDVAVDSPPVEAGVSTSVGDQRAVVPEAEFDDSAQFGGKKKNKKGKKGSNLKEAGDDDIDAILAQIEAPKGQAPKSVLDVSQSAAVDLAQSSAATASSKKKQKKGKKSGRTAQEEEDLDAILAELDAKPVDTGARSAPMDDAIPTLDADSLQDLSSTVDVSPSALEGAGAEAGEVVESAAAKKKKKKKEKEKEKAKAAGGETQPEAAQQVKEVKQEEPKAKASDKKLPKHVREMQERLAKMKELEEKRKQEEEEKRRKEEEELARLEELERQKEEAKRKRKEREKEKLLQKKKEGKLLNEKQKAEQRRLAAMREQFIAKTGTALAGDGSTEEPVTRPKPKYETKKKKRPSLVQPSDGHVEVDVLAGAEDQVIETKEVEMPMELEPTVETQVEPEEIVEEDVQGEDEDEDWDLKSWEQEVALPVIKSAFAEDEDLSLLGPSVSGKLSKSLSRQDSARSAITQQDSGSSVKGPAAPPSKAVSKQEEPESDDGETESDEETDSDADDAETKRRREARAKREARKADALNKRTADDLRSPICCILGHVDTGKTKLLDCIRRTNVQEGEAGGITQQIGATYFPMENIRERTRELQSQAKLRVPGLLVIDTPGHESFTNLRARGSSLCDIAILVIDIMHGLELQTFESLNLLKMRKTPFVVALNKVDRLYDWKPTPNAPIRDALNKQSRDVIAEFETRFTKVQTQLKEQGLNSELYYKNKEIRKVISVVPTSAISGEGVPDILMLLVQLTQKMMEDKLMYISEVQCTVLEVKVVEGLGTTIDVILVNGVLHEGDQIVVCGMQEPIVTNIRALLTPHPMKELRVKGSYQHHKELKAAQGIKLTAQGLEHAIAGTQLYVVGPDDDLEDIKDEAMQDMKNVMSRVDKSGEGVCVQASTLGSLEALLEFLKSPAVKIPVSGIGIGPVHKRDVMRASVMLERKRKEYATILAFDVKVSQEAKELAEESGVRIFMADIIYHLFDQFTAYMNSVKEEKRKESADEAVFPCVLEILPNCVFNKKDPIVVGVNVLEGIAKVGTPICVPSKDPTLESRFVNLGKIASIEVNHKEVDTAKKGQSVAMKIVGTNAEESQKMVGRHFTPEDQLVSSLTRRSIDLLKENYRDDLSTEDWRLVVKLKRLFEIP